MDHDERHTFREEHRANSAELLLPTGRAISCENCFRPMSEEIGLNWHTTLCGSPITIEQVYCEECLEEVILNRYRIRNVGEMTKELER